MTEEHNERTGMAKSLIDPLKSIPEPVRKRIPKALAQLAGHYFPDWVAQAASSQIELESRSIINKRLSEEVANRLVRDDDFMNRLVYRHISGEIKGQNNLDDISRIAIEASADSTKPFLDNDDQVSEIFIDSLIDVGKKANEEDIKILLGKMLAGEIREPGSVSLLTVRTVSALDKSAVESCLRILGYTVNGSQIHQQAVLPEFFSDILELHDYGIIQNVDALMYSKFTVNPGSKIDLTFKSSGVLMTVSSSMHPGASFEIPIFKLTRAGRDIYRIADFHESRKQFIKSVSAVWGKMAIESVKLGPIIGSNPVRIVDKKVLFELSELDNIEEKDIII